LDETPATIVPSHRKIDYILASLSLNQAGSITLNRRYFGGKTVSLIAAIQTQRDKIGEL